MDQYNFENNTIENIVKEGLLAKNYDAAIDYAELTLDSIIKNDIIRELPLISPFIGAINSAIKIKEIFFAKKIATFFKHFNNGKLDRDMHTNFMIKFTDDQDYRKSVTEQIMIMNERFVEVEKSKIMANLLQGHINGKIDLGQFCALSICLDGLNLRTLPYLEQLEKNNFIYSGGQGSTYEALLIPAGIVIRFGGHVQISNYGKYIYYCGIKGDINYNMEQSISPASQK